jgi:hypothetical protein
MVNTLYPHKALKMFKAMIPKSTMVVSHTIQLRLSNSYTIYKTKRNF